MPPKRDRQAIRLSRRRDMSIRRLQAVTDTRPNVIRNRDDAILDLGRLTNKVLDTIVARSREHAQPDGFPASTLGEGTGHSGNVSNPTATAVERHAGGKWARDAHGEYLLDRDGERIGLPDTWRQEADPVRDTIVEIELLLADILQQTARLATEPELVADVAKLARKVDRKRQYVTSLPNVVKWKTEGPCHCCHEKSEKLASGYCPPCRKAWERADYPDRVQFEHERRAYLEAKEARAS